MANLKEICIKRADDLPLETQIKYNVFKGFVEIRYEQHSDVEAEVIPLKQTTPSEKFRGVLKKAGFSQSDFK